MPTVYDAVNAIQRTAWRVNESILNTLNEAHDSKSPERQQIAGLPFQDNLPLPVKPLDIATNAEARRAWSKRAAPIYSENARAVSRRLQLRKTLYTAGQALADGTLYFTHQLDFRGRVYPLTTWLSPQAADYAKALLTFAEGEPITEQVQVDWLAIHGANCYGIDKVSMQDRITWVQEHEAEIIASAGDPFANRFWADGDKPWQFLAFCFEWAAMKKAGTWGYVSSLPVYVDGTCNGLQHFSAMLRDEVGGVATNLTPSEKPQDIYQTVADAAIKTLKASDDPLAKVWLNFGISRKTTKRSVMIVPYGGTLHACRSYIDMHVKDRVREGEVFPFSDPKEVKKACMFLAKIVWSAIDDTVVKAREAMKWLQKIARVMAKTKLPLQWRTPTGFTVRQAYPEWEKHQVKTLFHGKTLWLQVQEEGLGIKADKQATACSPNFVHSMDASALMLYAQRMGDAPLAMVHDAYGTTAARTEQMARLLREAFVEMYTNHDVLMEFRESCIKALGTDEGIPPVPKSGSLQIENVLNSRYFFA
jgi:DNA-directed RNA polymerase